jgi:hypothetical protein
MDEKREYEEIIEIQRPRSVKYGVTIGSFKKDPKDEKTCNISDAILYVPIDREFPLEPNKGGKSFGLFTVDGIFKEPIPDFEVLEVVLFLGKTLCGSRELKDWHKEKIKNFLEDFTKEAKLRGAVKNDKSKKR